MDQHLIFLLLGLANGAVFAALALALVVTYRSSGVLNFATGTIALSARTCTRSSARVSCSCWSRPVHRDDRRPRSNLGFWPAALLTLADLAALRAAALRARVPPAADGTAGRPRPSRRSA